MRERLADAQFAAGYLQSALEDGELAVLLLALRRIAEARGGMAKLAQATGLTREALYRTLSASGNPRLTSLAAILGATGLRLTIVPAEPARQRGKRASPTPKRSRIVAAA
jgi:probable addiction module antidote protein